MSPPKMLLIGNVSVSCHVGAMLGRAADSLGIQWTGIDLDTKSYAPSLHSFLGRVFFRLARGRPIEWWQFNRQAISQLIKTRPDFVVVSGMLPLRAEFFQICRKLGAKTVNLATDDPWASHLSHHSAFLPNIPFYDLIVSTKSRVVEDFHQHGAQRVEWFTYAFDPYWHRLPDPVPEEERIRFQAELSFIGTGNPTRCRELEDLGDIVPGTRLLYGNDWVRRIPRGWQPMGEALDNTFRLAVHEAKLTLALLRKGARDDSTQRTYEIAPCGGCGLYEDTPEHRAILSGYPEIGFFKSISHLGEICRRLLPDEAQRRELTEAGRRILLRPENTFSARLSSIIDWCDLDSRASANGQ